MHDQFVIVAFQNILRRDPTSTEISHYSEAIDHLGHAKLLELLFLSDEYLYQHRTENLSEYFAGHYHSPVVDPEYLRTQGFSVDRELPETMLKGLRIDSAAMEKFWVDGIDVMNAANIVQFKRHDQRYFAENPAYSWGDAYILHAMIYQLQPKRIVEIGSGYSSACMLDAIEQYSMDVKFTFVEPYPERLHSLLTDSDRQRCDIIERPIQDTEYDIYRLLDEGDILFIDSTHVSKTGSDVNFLLFEILPRLRRGVVIHFHDIHYPFEYPDEWIFQNRKSWNEAYLLRAFLMYNSAFDVLFFNDYFGQKFSSLAEKGPLHFRQNPGGGLWLRKVIDDSE
jgi:predicted O-methyltransferase YrrM